MPSFLSRVGTRVECPRESLPAIRSLFTQAGIAHTVTELHSEDADGNVISEIQVDPRCDLGAVSSIAMRINPLPSWYLEV